MIQLHSVVFGTLTPEAVVGQERLQQWLNDLSPRQISLLRSEFRHPERSATKPMIRKAQAAISNITGYTPGRQSLTESPSWGLAIRA